MNVQGSFNKLVLCTRAPREDMTWVFFFCIPFMRGQPGSYFLPCGCGRVHLERYVAEVGAGEPLMNRSPEVESFYTSWIWRRCRKAFAESKGNLCERCLKRGVIEPGSKDRPLEVHHKVPITAENVNDPGVALNWANLELLCKTCHDEERERKPKRWRIDKDGRVMI